MNDDKIEVSITLSKKDAGKLWMRVMQLEEELKEAKEKLDKFMAEAPQSAEEYLRSKYGAYRGHHAWRELEEAYNAGKKASSQLEEKALRMGWNDGLSAATNILSRYAETDLVVREINGLKRPIP